MSPHWRNVYKRADGEVYVGSVFHRTREFAESFRPHMLAVHGERVLFRIKVTPKCA